MDAQLKDKIWEKGRILDGLNPDEFRKDACGAIIMFSKFGMATDEFGWDIDFIYPLSRGGDDSVENLRPMHCLNIKSKGDDYPVYFRAVKANDEKRNAANRSQCKVSASVQAILKEHYGFND